MDMSTTLSRNDIRAILAEGLATLYFVMLSAGSVVAAIAVSGGLTDGALIVIALGHGIGILTAVAWTANLSGGHVNPAVSLAMIVSGNIRPVLGGLYIVAHFIGAVIGALLLKLATGDAFEGTLGTHALNPEIAVGEGLLLEILMTFFLLLVIYNVAVSKQGWGINAPVAIGLAVVVIHLVAVPFTGASVNPARSFGTALAAGEWADYWVYIVGPGVGAVLMALGWLAWRRLGNDDLETGAAIK